MTKEEAKLVLDSLATWEGEERMITAEHVKAIKVLSQEPCLSKDLDEAAEISFDEAKSLTEDYMDFLANGLIENKPRPIGPHWFCEYAKNRFIVGAKWQAEHQPLPEDTVLFNKGVAEGRRLESEENKDRDIVFWRGIQYAREQMMEEAVECDVIVPIYEGNDVWSAEIKIPGRYKLGDKVRVIVLPKED